MNESRGDYRSISPDGSRWKSMARLTNNLINRPNLINFVRQFCAPFQLMIRVHATWHVSSSPLPSPLPSHARSRPIPRFSLEPRFEPSGQPVEPNFSLMKIDFREFEGRVPVLTPPIEWPSFFPPFYPSEFSIFFFFFLISTQGTGRKSSRIFINLSSMKLLILNFIIEDNFSSQTIIFYCCLCKIELLKIFEVRSIAIIDY